MATNAEDSQAAVNKPIERRARRLRRRLKLRKKPERRQKKLLATLSAGRRLPF
jgi:hypothetical protein